MSEDKKYNGWTNYETWNMNLWIDQDNQQYFQDRAYEIYENSKATEFLSRADVSKNELSNDMKDYFDEMCPDLGASVWAYLLNASLREVNWYEIASNIIDNIVIESKRVKS